MLQAISKQFNSFRLALAFMTLMPVAPKKIADDEEWAASIKYYPVVALFFSTLQFLVLTIFTLFLPDKDLLLALSLVLAAVFLSGGLHLDGLMDSFDGIAASKKTHEETREVMRDSRSGAFAVMAGSLFLLAKFASILQLNLVSQSLLVWFLFLLLPVLSRASVVWTMAFQSKEAKKKASKVSALFGDFNRVPACILAVMLIMAMFAAFAYLNSMFNGSGFELIFAAVFIAVVLLLSQLVYLYLSKKLFGHSGDSLGAGIEITELIGCFLLALLV